MSRILLVTDHPSLNSGYGIIGSHLADLFVSLGHAVEYLAWFGNSTLQKKSYKIHNTFGTDKWGISTFPEIVDSFNPEVVLTTGDIWMCYHIPLFKSADSFRSIWLAPIDSEGMIPLITAGLKQTIPVTKSISMFNHVVAQTEFCRGEVGKLIGAGPCKDVIYPGYDSESIYPLPEEERRKIKKTLTGSEDTFFVLYISRNGTRKNPIGAMEAFAKANIPNSKMYFHCHHHEPQGYNLSAAATALGIQDRIILSSVPVASGISRNALNRLYNAADVHLLLSVREGFGLTFLEAAAAGVPSVFTMANCAKEFGDEIGIGVQPVATLHETITHSIMQIPSIDKAAEALRIIYDEKCQGTHILRRAKCLRFAENYTWEKVLSRWTRFLETVDIGKNSTYISPHEKLRRTFPLVKRPEQKKVGLFTTWNESCGIARYSQHLAEKLSSDVTILTPETAGITTTFEMTKCWSRGKDNLLNLYQTVRDKGISILHFQMDWGFMLENMPTYYALLDQLRASGIKSVITFHTMPTNATDPMARATAQQVVMLMRHADVGIVHARAFLETMKTIDPDTAKKLRVVAHGVESVDLYVKKNDIFTCVSSGFAHPSKGFEYCVDASREMSIPHRMIIHSSVHPHDIGSQKAYLDMIREKSQDAPNVELVVQHLSDLEVTKLYAEATLGIFMYGTMSAQGVAGGASVCLGAGTPILTSFSPAFASMIGYEDMGEPVPMNAGDLAKRIEMIYQDGWILGRMEHAADEYRKEYSWMNTARAHEQIYRELS